MNKLGKIFLASSFFVIPYAYGSGEDATHGHTAKGAEGPGHAASAHWMAPEEAAARSNPVPVSDDSIQRGQSLYQSTCASCHGATGHGDGPAGKASTPPAANLAVMASQHPDGDFAWKISEGRGAMPPWKGILNDTQIWDLVNFIKNGLGGNGESASQQPSQSEHKNGHGDSH